MSIKIKKKSIKIIIGIVLVILLVVASIVLKPVIINNSMVKQTEERLCSIDSKKLESQIIEKLKDTEMYINVEENNISSFKQEYGKDVTKLITEIGKGNQFKEYITVSIKTLNKNSIVASIEIPCFKISSDTNGKFKSIEYNKNIREIIKSVFKENYNIDLTITDNEKYCKRFNEEVSVRGATNKGQIYITDRKFFDIISKTIQNRINVYEEIEGGSNISNLTREYSTTTFGLEF